MQGCVGLAVAAAVEAVPLDLAGGCLDGADAAQGSEGRVADQPVGVVAGGDEERGGGVRAKTGPRQKVGDVAVHQTAQAAARTVAVLSAAYLSSAYAETEWQASRAADPTGRARKLLVVRIEDCPRPGLLSQLVSVDLSGIDQDTVVNRLVAAARGQRAKPVVEPLFPGGPTGSVVSAARAEPVFPGRLPDVWGPMSTRNLPFTGRDRILADLHTRLTDTGQVAVAGVQDFGGSGKTQLAVEYAWRYRAGLDLVWWVDTETTGLEAGLSDLAAVLRVGDGDVPARARAALAELGRRQRWLLVFDNIPGPATLARLLHPPSPGLEVLLAHELAASGWVAAIGYCFGGALALELTRGGVDLKAVVGFHSGLSTPRPKDADYINLAYLVVATVNSSGFMRRMDPPANGRHDVVTRRQGAVGARTTPRRTHHGSP